MRFTVLIAVSLACETQRSTAVPFIFGFDALLMGWAISS